MIGSPYLHAIKAGLFAAPGCLDKGFYGVFDFTIGHGMAPIAIVIAGHTRRGPGGVKSVVRITMLANVVELLKDHRPFGMYGVRDGSKVRNDGVVAMAEVPPCQHGSGMDRHGFDDEHRGATDRPLDIVGPVLLGRQTIQCHVRRMRTKDDAIAQPMSSDVNRRKKPWIGSRCFVVVHRHQHVLAGRVSGLCLFHKVMKPVPYARTGHGLATTHALTYGSARWQPRQSLAPSVRDHHR